MHKDDVEQSGMARPVRTMWRTLIPAGLALLAFATGTLYFSHYSGTPANYQHLMGPAVMLASGHGFVNPDLEALPELKAFLTPPPSLTELPPVDRFDPATLPELIPQLPVEGYQIRHQYMFYTIAAIWKFAGISWSVLAPLHGLFYAATAAALYGLFCLALPRSWAIFGVLVLIFSPMQLNNLLRFRDYAKAPFLIVAIFVAGYLMLRPLSRRGLYFWAGLAGLAMGLGYGFRQDTLIALPALSAVLLFFVHSPGVHPWPRRLACAGLCWGAFYLGSFPAQREMDASEKYHHLVQGLCPIYDGRLGAGDVPYTVVHRYFDLETTGIFQAYTKPREGAFRALELSTRDYEDVGRDYARELFYTFPADFVLRAWMAVRRTIDEMGADPDAPAPRAVESPWLLSLAAARARLHALLVRYAHYGVPLLLLCLAARDLRPAFGWLFLLCYFGGYAAIQFAGRHNFHLQFVSLFAMLCLLERSLRITQALVRRGEGRTVLLESLAHLSRTHAMRAAMFAAVFLAGLFGPLWLARVWQQHQVRGLFDAYVVAERAPLRLQRDSGSEGWQTVSLWRADASPVFASPPRETGFDAAFLMAEFDTASGPVTARIEYTASQFDFAPGWVLELPKTSSGSTRVWFPVYAFYSPGRHGQRETTSFFRGLEIREEEAARLLGVEEMLHPEQYPLWLSARLAPDWRGQPLYQRRTR